MAAARTVKVTVRGNIGSRVVAVCAWGVGVWTTHLFLRIIVREADWTLFAAFILQAIFTAAESPLWNGRGKWFNGVMLGIDTIINVGGFYSYITRLDQTDSWAAFNAGLGTSGGMHPLAALIVSIVLGVIVAATPEFLWRQE